ncbi:hypothetical protein QJR30_01650 [Paraclostridium sordellii]|uniref:hypothetical protein n=1 Tax=Paraclostridium sordellii TaxID=1505 RepID=UPI0005E1B0D2|nr:hypothetical protein [Paeniclostridium sordellii]CEP81962.1 Uncharacterised protein [[Clostridium] sordellii] [Paeniclostridium sordellii]
MTSQEIKDILLAVIGMFAAGFTINWAVKKVRKKDSNKIGSINQNGASYNGNVNQSGRDNNVR